MKTQKQEVDVDKLFRSQIWDAMNDVIDEIRGDGKKATPSLIWKYVDSHTSHVFADQPIAIRSALNDSISRLVRAHV